MAEPVLALTQGDPAGIGPEILLKALHLVAQESPAPGWRPLLLVEHAALDVLRGRIEAPWDRLVPMECLPDRAQIDALPAGSIAVVDPVAVADPAAEPRSVRPGEPTADDARGALAALDLGIDAAQRGIADALVTAPLNKAVVARHCLPGFVGHTDYLAARCGLQQYGRDYLMTFLAPDLRVALLSTHLPLRRAIDAITAESVLDALLCLDRALSAGVGAKGGGATKNQEADAPRRIALAGLNPHAGEGGLLGSEDDEILRPAVEEARRRGIDVRGPESPDTVFLRARRGEFDWVLALYHDQGLIAVKTPSFGDSVHLTTGLPFLRTSVDHGTAYDLAGRGAADARPMLTVLHATVDMLV